MSTTQLLVEYLIIGAISNIWIFILLATLFPLGNTTSQSIIETANKFSSILILMLIPITYTIGGIITFIADALLGKAFQKKYRNRLFANENVDYKTARNTVYQFAPSDTIDRLKYHGHILRISRGNVLNFTIMSVAIATLIRDYPTSASIGVVISVIFAIVSFLQWRKRYENNFDDILGAYKVITRISKKPGTKLSIKSKNQ